MHKPGETKTTRACLDARYAELERATEGVRPTPEQCRDAAACLVPSPRAHRTPKPENVLLVMLLLVVALALAGCACGHAGAAREIHESVELILERDAIAAVRSLTPGELLELERARRSVRALARSMDEDADAND